MQSSSTFTHIQTTLSSPSHFAICLHSEAITQRGVWQCIVKTSDTANAGTDANGRQLPLL